MIQVETRAQYKSAWEKRLQLEKRMKKSSKISDKECLRTLKRKMRRYANKEVTKSDIYWYMWGNNHKA